jgi:tetratricopeptide (TPR) repeat protein
LQTRPRRQDRIRDAIPLLEKALEIDPDNPLILYRLGEMRSRTDDTEGAVHALSEAIKRGMSSPWAFYRLAYTLASMERWSEAAQAARQAVDQEPNRESFRHLLRTVEAKLGPPEKSD